MPSIPGHSGTFQSPITAVFYFHDPISITYFPSHNILTCTNYLPETTASKWQRQALEMPEISTLFSSRDRKMEEHFHCCLSGISFLHVPDDIELYQKAYDNREFLPCMYSWTCTGGTRVAHV